MVKQVSVFLENKEGRLVRALDILGKENINIRALSIAETADFGILRLIVDKPETAVEILKNVGFRVIETDVLAVEVNDQPGGLALALAELAQQGVNIEYMYAFLAKQSDNALVIFRVEDKEKAQVILGDAGIKVLESDTIDGL